MRRQHKFVHGPSSGKEEVSVKSTTSSSEERLRDYGVVGMTVVCSTTQFRLRHPTRVVQSDTTALPERKKSTNLKNGNGTTVVRGAVGHLSKVTYDSARRSNEAATRTQLYRVRCCMIGRRARISVAKVLHPSPQTWHSTTRRAIAQLNRDPAAAIDPLCP